MNLLTQIQSAMSEMELLAEMLKSHGREDKAHEVLGAVGMLDEWYREINNDKPGE